MSLRPPWRVPSPPESMPPMIMIEASIHPLILGVIRELPKPGTRMTRLRRAQWVNAFESILSLLYPEEDQPPCD